MQQPSRSQENLALPMTNPAELTPTEAYKEKGKGILIKANKEGTIEPNKKGRYDLLSH